MWLSHLEMGNLSQEGASVVIDRYEDECGRDVKDAVMIFNMQLDVGETAEEEMIWHSFDGVIFLLESSAITFSFLACSNNFIFFVILFIF